MPKKGKCSALQKAQSAQALDVTHTKKKENHPPSATTVLSSELEAALTKAQLEKQQGDEYKKRARNEQWKHNRSEAQLKTYKASCSQIEGDLLETSEQLKVATQEQAALVLRNANLKIHNNALQQQRDSLQRVKERVASGKMAAAEKAKQIWLKEKGVISAST